MEYNPDRQLREQLLQRERRADSYTSGREEYSEGGSSRDSEDGERTEEYGELDFVKVSLQIITANNSQQLTHCLHQI